MKSTKRRHLPQPQSKDTFTIVEYYCLTDLFNMQLPLQLSIYPVFLGLTRSFPLPSKSNTASFRVVALSCSHRGLSASNDQSSAAGYNTFGRAQVWGGTPANTSICRNPALWTGKWWWAMGSIALLLVALYGLLAFVMWGIMSVDLPKLTIWNRTGDKRRR